MADRIYLDWNATAPLRPEARAAMAAALDDPGNPSSIHAEGRMVRQRVERAREQVAALVGAAPKLVTFAAGGTEANISRSVRPFRWATASRRWTGCWSRRSSMCRCVRADICRRSAGGNSGHHIRCRRCRGAGAPTTDLTAQGQRVVGVGDARQQRDWHRSTNS
jgi:cysteine desulfurase